MLPDIHLDRMTFDEIVERAKNRIVGFYPAWTDFNYHDPGITLIELFAWQKEIQQYGMDHIGDYHKRKYLQLMGTDIRHRSAANCYVTAAPETPVLLPEGSRMEAPGVSFETIEEQMLPAVFLKSCFGRLEETVSFLDGEQMSLGRLLAFYPFGQKAQAGTCLYLELSDGLPTEERIALTIRVSRQEKCQRNPAASDTIPLARLSFTYWNGVRYEPVELLRDETFGLLFDGQIVFRLHSVMKKGSVGEREGYFLRIRMEEGQYEAPPTLSFLDLNTVRVRQKETVAKWLPAAKLPEENALLAEHSLCARGTVRVFSCRDGYYRQEKILDKTADPDSGRVTIRLEEDVEASVEPEASKKGAQDRAATYWAAADNGEDWYRTHGVLGVAHGFPGESFFLDDEAVSCDDVEILVEEAEQPEVYRRWERREDFSASGPEDPHFGVDGMTGRVYFGDGIHGMAPEGKILLVSYARTLGSGGNVKAVRIGRMPDREGLTVSNLWDAYDGQDEESVQDAFVRVRKALAQSKNLVTTWDYEQRVRSTPGLRIESCKAFYRVKDGQKQADRELSIVVKPYSLEKQPKLFPIYAQNILQHLEKKRLLGVRLKLLSPVYIRLSVSLEVAVYPHYHLAESTVERAVETYLAAMREEFGGTVSYSGLYGYVDRLECVCGVRSLTLEAKGNDVRRNTYGDLIFPGNGIADEIEVQCSCSIQA